MGGSAANGQSNKAGSGGEEKRASPSGKKTAPSAKRAKHGASNGGFMSVKEMEKSFPKKTLKYAVFKVLQKHGLHEGMSADEIITKGESMGFSNMKGGDVSCKRQVAKILCVEPNFERIKLGVYSLACYQMNANRQSQQPGGSEVVALDRSKLARQIAAWKAKRDKLRQELGRKEEELASVSKHLEEDKEAMVTQNSIPLAQAMQVDPSALKEFEMTEEEKIFTGDENDRKAMLEHRQRVQCRAKELDQARDTFISEFKDGIVRQRKELAAKLKHQQQSKDNLDSEIESVREKIADLDQNISSAEEKMTLCPPKKSTKKAASLPRGPLEDEDIPDKPPLFEPAWLDAEAASRFAKLLAISDNLILIGTRNLGVKAPPFQELQDMLESSTMNAPEGISNSLAPDALHQLYSNLLELIIGDAMETGDDLKGHTRWSKALSDGSWPEILRRFILLRDSEEKSLYERPDTHASLAASMLAYNPVEDLTNDQHVSLLHYLTDNVLIDSACFRNVLQNRENAAMDAKRDAKDEMAEERKRLKEIQEAKKHLVEHGQANESETNQTDFSLEDVELPEEYKEFKGNPVTQKEEYEAFLKSQASMKRKLEKERVKKFADKVRAERAEAARLKKLEEDRQNMVKEIEAAEEALELARQAYQDKVEKLKIRRDPLGFDRHHRRYWYGVGGYKSGILVEGSNGKLACIQTEQDLDSLLSSLDSRGVREKKLSEELKSIKDFVTQGMRREKNKQSEPDTVPSKEGPLRQSSRQSRQVEFFDPSKPANAPRRPPKASPQAIRDQLSILPLPSSVNIAYSDAIFILIEIKRDAIEAGISGPPGDESWEKWTRDTTTFGHEYGSTEYKSTPSKRIMDILKGKAFELESVLNMKSEILQGKRQEEEEEEGSGSGSEPVSSDQSNAPSSPVPHQSDIDSIPLTSPSKFTETIDTAFVSKKNPKESKFLWHTLRERVAWMTDLKSTATPARLAFNVNLLRLQSKPIFRFMANQDK
ncbi:hypothetical protein M9434_004133 [Picochlorum sp. BPE23]|nr:hypothetical protein M9434_004133 [Picochlorum sp. BPE23]